jgi:predicted house-cleaning noncanonical NTP pyrophosphatase (MazG superfamily)
MLKFQFKKLVRDKIVDQQIASGAKPIYHRLAENELRHELVKKIQEESSEIINTDHDTVAGEIADVQQAIDDLILACKLTKTEVADKQRLKNEKNGSFSKGIYVEYVEVDENDKWVNYYRENADRYPQIR